MIPVELDVIFSDVRAAICTPDAGKTRAVELAVIFPTVASPLINNAPEKMIPVELYVNELSAAGKSTRAFAKNRAGYSVDAP